MHPMNHFQEESRRLEAFEVGHALALGRDPKGLPLRKPCKQAPGPIKPPPPAGTERFCKTVEQDCEECGGSGRDAGAVEELAWDAPGCSHCFGTGREMVSRNFLAEAFTIALNEHSTKPIEREHLVAVIDYCRGCVSATMALPEVVLGGEAA